MARETTDGLPNSMYNKIYDVLHIGFKKKDVLLPDLVTSILANKLDSFMYWAPRSEEGDRRRPCSPAVVRRTVRFMSSLSLVQLEGASDVICNLTTDGTNALKTGRFNSTLANRVQIRMADLGYGYGQLLKAIKAVQLPNVPNAVTLYELRPATAENMPESTFKRMLGLLAACGELRTANAHMYLSLGGAVTDE